MIVERKRRILLAGDNRTSCRLMHQVLVDEGGGHGREGGQAEETDRQQTDQGGWASRSHAGPHSACETIVQTAASDL